MPILQTRQLRHRPGKRTPDSTSGGLNPQSDPRACPGTTSPPLLQLHCMRLLEVHSQPMPTGKDGGMESEMTLLDSIQKRHIEKGALQPAPPGTVTHKSHACPRPPCALRCVMHNTRVSLTASAEHLHEATFLCT